MFSNMKITPLHLITPKTYSFKNRPENVNNLSGVDVLDKYKRIFKEDEARQEKQNDKLNEILSCAFYLFANNGYYKSAKVLYNEVKKIYDTSDQQELDKMLGAINKEQGDIEAARFNYKSVYDNQNINYKDLTLDNLYLIKNLADTSLSVNNDTDCDIDKLRNSNSSRLNYVYLYLQSKIDLINDKKEESFNNINLAYSLMAAKSLSDNDVVLGKAMALSERGEYSKSSKILKQNLEYLENNNKVYSREFVENLLLLGVNDFELQQGRDYKKIINLFENAAKIAKEVDIPELAEIANFLVAKTMYSKKDSAFGEFAENLLEQTDNIVYKITLNEMLGDFFATKDKDKAVSFYNSAKNFAIEVNNDDVKFIDLCEKIKKISSEQEEKINSEIKSLGLANLYNRGFLIRNILNNYSEGNLDLVKNICERVIHKSRDEINKNIARVYLNFVNIKGGSDLKKTIDENKRIISNLANESTQMNGDILINRFLFASNRTMAGILYRAQRYVDAAYYKNVSSNYIDCFNDTNYVLIHKIETILMNYKAKNYYIAEKNAIEYLEILIGEKLSQRPTEITEKINDILSNKNDTEKRKIASVYETLGLINLKNRNIKDSERYFSNAATIRESLFDRDLQLANTYSALARLAIINKNIFKGGVSSKDMHRKALEILNDKYANMPITKEENDFHKKYYGFNKVSVGKYAKSLLGNNDEIIEKFKCYNKELSICE